MKVLENGIYKETDDIIEVSPEIQIEQLKQELFNTDYQAIKFAEGWISKEEYAQIKAKRQAIRSKINEFEKIIQK